MPRPAKYTSDDILDGVARVLVEKGAGALSIAAVSNALGAPSGSIYHRFPSRSDLLANVWLRSVKRFQSGFVEALGGDDVAASGVDAALFVARWTRENMWEAQVLLLFRPADLESDHWSPTLRRTATRLRNQLLRAIGEWAARAGVSTERATFALVDVPYAGVRRHLRARQSPPTEMDELIADAVRALVEVGAPRRRSARAGDD